MSDIIQRLALGTLTEDEKKGYSDRSKEYATGQLPPLEPRKVRFTLTKEEQLSICEDVKHRVIQGATADDIGKAVLACMQEHLREKESQAYPDEEENKGSVGKIFGSGKSSFRRV